MDEKKALFVRILSEAAEAMEQKGTIAPLLGCAAILRQELVVPESTVAFVAFVISSIATRCSDLMASESWQHLTPGFRSAHDYERDLVKKLAPDLRQAANDLRTVGSSGNDVWNMRGEYRAIANLFWDTIDLQRTVMVLNLNR
ncbi:MAG: hypothetical protein HY092_00800 [Candidatus Kerfeldbacteria bacterium]|nr:hypothetical protein [Candidatus Kerfeldbacteria bacterium]